MQYRLRTLLIVLALGPPVLAGGWWGWQAWSEANETKFVIVTIDEGIEIIEIIDEPAATEPEGTTVIHPDFAFAPVSATGPSDGGKVLLDGIRRMRQRRSWWWRLTSWQPASEPRR